MNVYIAKWLSLPALRTAHAYDYGPAHRQDRKAGSRKQEQEASTRHSRSRHGDERMDGRTDGQMDKRADRRAPLSICADSYRDAEGTQWKKEKNW